MPDVHSADGQFFEDRLNPIVAVLLVLVGIGLLAHPLYVWPHYAQSPFVVHVQPTSDQPEQFVEFESLDPAAQAAFEQAFGDGRHTLWSGDDDRAIRTLQTTPAVHYDGEYYRVAVQHTDSGFDFTILVRWFITALGAFLLVFGGLAVSKGSWYPFTPLNALLVPVAVLLGFFLTNVYDVLFSGVRGSVWWHGAVGLIELIPLTTGFLAVGSEVARNGRRSRRAIGGSVVIVLGSAVVIGSPSIALLIGGVLTLVGGVPWFWLGDKYTSPG